MEVFECVCDTISDIATLPTGKEVESNKLLRDERGAYLIEQKED